jgi:hypothetical protein
MSANKHFIFAITLFVLTGCASTGIIQSGSDRYMVSKTSLQIGFGAPTAVHGEISQEANDFCAKQNKKMEIINTTITHPALGRPGSATLEFRCIAEEKPYRS